MIRIFLRLVEKMFQMRRSKIPVSVIIVTKNEESRIERCLAALSDFDEVVVVDSNSDDKTLELACSQGARVENFIWNGHYPKKRQWCLDNLKLEYDWVFFVDADEIVTTEMVQEIAALFEAEPPCEAGFFVASKYVWMGKILQHGLRNQKLVLFDRRCFEFPVVDDLDVLGMGEIEGHYQPVLRATYAAEEIGALRGFMHHYACDVRDEWVEKHKSYAVWEVGMNAKSAWVQDPKDSREFIKRVFRNMPFRDVAAFLHSYVLKAGFLDGFAGLNFALSRAWYYKTISSALKTNTSLE